MCVEHRGTSALDGLGFVDRVAVVVACGQAGCGTDGAIDVGDGTGRSAHDVVMVIPVSQRSQQRSRPRWAASRSTPQQRQRPLARPAPKGSAAQEHVIAAPGKVAPPNYRRSSAFAHIPSRTSGPRGLTDPSDQKSNGAPGPNGRSRMMPSARESTRLVEPTERARSDHTRNARGPTTRASRSCRARASEPRPIARRGTTTTSSTQHARGRAAS